MNTATTINWPRSIRAILTVITAIAGIGFALIHVPTSLGVKVPEAIDLYGITTTVDKSGNDAIWRVWWRARDQIFDLHRQLPMTIGLLLLLTTFVTCLLGCVWFALSIPVSDPESIRE
jgi:hypothetical protein